MTPDWVTVRGSSTVTTVTQSDEGWLDLLGCAEAQFFVEIAEVTAPVGSVSGSVLLQLETSPTGDESTFVAVAGPIVCTPTTAPIVLKTASLGAVPLCRFNRWKVLATTAASWDVTFRIRATANRSFYFAPTQLSDCLLWLRADLGVTFSSSGTVSAWEDWSNNGHGASQTTGADQPTYSSTAINGFPALNGNGTSQCMNTNAFVIGSSATLFAVVQSTPATQPAYTRILDHQYNASYYLGTDSTGGEYKLIVDDGTSPYGTAQGGTIAANTNAIVSGTFSAPTGTLYVNGTSIASDSTDFGTPTSPSNQLWIMQCYANSFAEYWSGYLAEVVIYGRALAAAELTRVHRYLGARYSITVP
jgi:Concanavalin A-like lectin/glucanases superfamily